MKFNKNINFSQKYSMRDVCNLNPIYHGNPITMMNMIINKTANENCAPTNTNTVVFYFFCQAVWSEVRSSLVRGCLLAAKYSANCAATGSELRVATATTTPFFR